MKKKLLYLTSIVLFSALSVNAQTNVWDFDTSAATVNGTPGTFWSKTPYATETIDNLIAFTPNNSKGDFGLVGTTSTPTDFGDGYKPLNGFKSGGAGYSGTGNPAVPTQRYISVNVNQASTLKVWFKGGNSTSTRTEAVSDGTTILGSAQSVNGAPVILTVVLPKAGQYSIYNDLVGGNTIYKIEVTGAAIVTPTLATGSFQAGSSVVVYANDGKINVSNVTSTTKVSVYSVLGSLVKSTEVSADASLDINNGVYIVKVQSAEGSKTTKVIVQ